jgi:hypothetical protein
MPFDETTGWYTPTEPAPAPVHHSSLDDLLFPGTVAYVPPAPAPAPTRRAVPQADWHTLRVWGFRHVSHHEAVHAVAARRGGLPVLSSVASLDGSGLTMVGYDPKDPASIVAHGVSLAAAVATDRRLGAEPHGHANDLEQLSECAALYRDVARRKMPDVFALAAVMLREPLVGDSIVRVARALDPGAALSGSQIDAQLEFTPPTN